MSRRSSDHPHRRHVRGARARARPARRDPAHDLVAGRRDRRAARAATRPPATRWCCSPPRCPTPPRSPTCTAPHALEVVTAEVARRTLQHETLQARLLRASPLGGFLAAVVVDRGLARAQVEAAARRRTPPGRRDRRPGLAGASPSGPPSATHDDEIWSVVRDVRGAVVAAGREAPGATRWQVGAAPRRRGRRARRGSATWPARSRPPRPARTCTTSRSTTCAAAASSAPRPCCAGPTPCAAPCRRGRRRGRRAHRADRPLGRIVLDQALDQVAAWGDRLDPDFRMHVNVSPARAARAVVRRPRRGRPGPLRRRRRRPAARDHRDRAARPTSRRCARRCIALATWGSGSASTTSAPATPRSPTSTGSRSTWSRSTGRWCRHRRRRRRLRATRACCMVATLGVDGRGRGHRERPGGRPPALDGLRLRAGLSPRPAGAGGGVPRAGPRPGPARA